MASNSESDNGRPLSYEPHEPRDLEQCPHVSDSDHLASLYDLLGFLYVRIDGPDHDLIDGEFEFEVSERDRVTAEISIYERKRAEQSMESRRCLLPPCAFHGHESIRQLVHANICPLVNEDCHGDCFKAANEALDVLAALRDAVNCEYIASTQLLLSRLVNLHPTGNCAKSHANTLAKVFLRTFPPAFWIVPVP